MLQHLKRSQWLAKLLALPHMLQGVAHHALHEAYSFGANAQCGHVLQAASQVLGVSVDSEFVHLAWRKDKEELRNLPFPMLSDIKRELSTELGVLDAEAGVAQRATYIVDPEGVIRFVYVTDLNVGRSPEEVLRVLDGLQTDELCPCNWQKGEDTLKAA